MSEKTRKIVERYYPQYMEPNEPVYAVEYWDDEWADWIDLVETPSLDDARFSAMKIARENRKSRVVEVRDGD